MLQLELRGSGYTGILESIHPFSTVEICAGMVGKGMSKPGSGLQWAAERCDVRLAA